MKSVLTAIITLFAIVQLEAQTYPPPVECPYPGRVEVPDAGPPLPDTTLFAFADEMPMFPGGDSAWRKFVMKTMRYPNPEVEGTVYVRFIVERDGSVTNVEVVKHPNSQAMALEARAIVMNSPNWIPGKQDGKAVRVQMVMPIRFVL